MQVNVDSTRLRQRPIGLPALLPWTLDGANADRSETSTPRATLLTVRQEGVRAWNQEGIVWLILGLSSAAALLLSLWG